MIKEKESKTKTTYFMLPPRFLSELRVFRLKNAVAEIEDKKGNTKIECCERCLKAHAIITANKMKLSDNILLYIGKVFPIEAGHNGYYMNQDQVVMIPKETKDKYYIQTSINNLRKNRL